MIPAACLLGLLYGLLLRKGNWKSIFRKHFRLLWLLFLSLACEFALTTGWLPGKLGGQPAYPAVRVCLALLQYGSLLVFLFSNRRKPGVYLLLAGSFLNGLVIVSNRGRMPIGPAVVRFGEAAVKNIAALPHYFLASGREPFYLLGDLIPFWTLSWYMISIGDILISAGIFLLAAYMSRKVLRPRGKAVEQPPDIGYTEGR